MKYSIGQCLGEYGFAFYENLHAPIFLVHRAGTIKKMNRAARKFLSVASFGCHDLEKTMGDSFKQSLAAHPAGGFRWKIPNLDLKFIIRILEESDFVLVEVLR